MRAASEEQLVEQSLPRIRSLMAEGVTTLEIKSGYGLDPDSELKMLKVIEQLAQTHPCDIVPTFLGAHTVPPEFQDDANADLLKLYITN